jgi:hypothetical protein
MGVGPPDAGYGYAFSRDVLVLEISGPEQQHFSVIDVPGTFTRTEQGQTTKEDMALVDQMVHDYMSNPRSVMLVVVPCNVDIATQGIVERAVELDLEGIRTIGILTKPDLVDKGAESAIIDLMENRRHRLKLGWHLLKNPGQAEDSSTRNELETAFFQKFPPWCNLKKDTVGVKSLMVRLQTILDSHIKREFPKVS